MSANVSIWKCEWLPLSRVIEYSKLVLHSGANSRIRWNLRFQTFFTFRKQGKLQIYLLIMLHPLFMKAGSEGVDHRPGGIPRRLGPFTARTLWTDLPFAYMFSFQYDVSLIGVHDPFVFYLYPYQVRRFRDSAFSTCNCHSVVAHVQEEKPSSSAIKW